MPWDPRAAYGRVPPNLGRDGDPQVNGARVGPGRPGAPEGLARGRLAEALLSAACGPVPTARLLGRSCRLWKVTHALCTPTCRPSELSASQSDGKAES